jgi:hypothetical protein
MTHTEPLRPGRCRGAASGELGTTSSRRIEACYLFSTQGRTMTMSSAPNVTTLQVAADRGAGVVSNSVYFHNS